MKKNDNEPTDVQNGQMPKPLTESLGAAYNFEANRLKQDYASTKGGKRILTRAPLRKPNNTEFFRTKAGFEYESMLLEAPDSGGLYMVDHGLWDEVGNLIKAKHLVPYVNRKGEVGLWPLSVQNPERPNLWTETAHDAAKLAQDIWIRMESDMEAGFYKTFDAHTGIIPEPIWPEGIETAILGLAFKGRVITSLDHPVLMKLMGKA